MKAQIWMTMEWIVNLGEAGEVGEQDQSTMRESPPHQKKFKKYV